MKVRRLRRLRQPPPRFCLFTDWRGRTSRIPPVTRRLARFLRAFGTP